MMHSFSQATCTHHCHILLDSVMSDRLICSTMLNIYN